MMLLTVISSCSLVSADTECQKQHRNTINPGWQQAPFFEENRDFKDSRTTSAHALLVLCKGREKAGITPVSNS